MLLNSLIIYITIFYKFLFEFAEKELVDFEL